MNVKKLNKNNIFHQTQVKFEEQKLRNMSESKLPNHSLIIEKIGFKRNVSDVSAVKSLIFEALLNFKTKSKV